jgi:hypothetical protein
MDRLSATNNQVMIRQAMGFGTMQLMGGLPDFLELSPEQRELITRQQTETTSKVSALSTQASMKSNTENPEKLQQVQKLQKEYNEAPTKEEQIEIGRKIQEINKDVLKDVLPEIKRLLIKGREDFYRVLTDAQKAKIKAVMADMPDYMKKLFAEVDKGGDMSNVLNSWVPGMGAPGTNPNREAPRERTNTGGGRAFPGD